MTATFYLLAERKLKRQHTVQQKPVMRSRPGTVPWPPRLEHSLSTPTETGCSVRYNQCYNISVCGLVAMLVQL